MSTQLPTDLEVFQRFLTEQIATGNRELSPEESLKIWREQQRDYEETVEAVKEGLADVEAGRVFPLAQVADEIRKQHGWSADT